jgi:hypothetical protein
MIATYKRSLGFTTMPLGVCKITAVRTVGAVLSCLHAKTSSRPR